MYFDDAALEDWADAHCEDPAQIRRSERKQEDDAGENDEE